MIFNGRIIIPSKFTKIVFLPADLQLLTSLAKTQKRAAAARLLGESSKLRSKIASTIVFAILKKRYTSKIRVKTCPTLHRNFDYCKGIEMHTIDMTKGGNKK